MAKSNKQAKSKKKRNKRRKQKADDEQDVVNSTLDQLIINLVGHLIEAKKQVAIGIADEKRLAKQTEDEMAKAAEWERRAALASQANDQGLAEEALVRKREHDATAAVYHQMWVQHKRYVDKLKWSLRSINNKINRAKRRKEQVARQLRAIDSCEKLATIGYGVERTLGLMDALAFATVKDEQPAVSSEDLCPLCASRFPPLQAALAAVRAGNHDKAAALLSELDV